MTRRRGIHALLHEATRGDDDIRRFLDHRYLPLVASFCRSYIGEQIIAEAVAREVMVSAYDAPAPRRESAFIRRLARRTTQICREAIHDNPSLMRAKVRTSRTAPAERGSERAAFFAAWGELSAGERLLARHCLFEGLEVQGVALWRHTLVARVYTTAFRLRARRQLLPAWQRASDG